MKIFSICLLLALPISVFLASIEMPVHVESELQQLELLVKALSQTKGSFDLVLNLLPLYGWIKLKWFMTRSTLDKCYVNKKRITEVGIIFLFKKKIIYQIGFHERSPRALAKVHR
jgi:hypothetical protein